MLRSAITILRFMLMTGLVMYSRQVLAQSDSVDDYVILANRLVEFSRVGLIASGNAGVQEHGGLFTASRQLVSGIDTHIVSDDVSIRGPGSLYSLWANDTGGVERSVVIRRPGEPVGFPPPILAQFPPVPLITAGTLPVAVARFETRTLSPGAYADLRMKSRGTLVLTGGDYTFASMRMGLGTRILLAGPTVMNVAGDVRIGRSSLITPITPGVRASDIQINIAGEKVRIRKRNTVAAKFLAPQAEIRVGGGSFVEGQLVGDRVRLGPGIVVQAAAAPLFFPLRTPTQTPVPPPPAPTATSTPVIVLTGTPVAPTNTPVGPTGTPIAPTNTPVGPTATMTAVPTAPHTGVPTATNTPVPTATDTRVPTATATADPTVAHTGIPTATETTQPSATSTSAATATSPPGATPTNTSPTAPTATRTPTEVSIPPSVTATLGPGTEPPECGNGVREGGEECDDGNDDDDDECSNECRDDDDDSLGRQFCTLTQGGWGAPDGVGNGPQGFVTRYPGILPVTIGGPGQSTEIRTQSALVAYLPHGGKPAPLYPGERYFSAPEHIVDDGGGTLAAQAISVALAVNLSGELAGAYQEFADFELPRHRFCTQSMLAGTDGILGTVDDVVDTGAAIAEWRLPESVREAGHEIEDLLNMANQYLRGGSAPPDISEVNEALDMINQAFDECRRVVACP